MPITIDRKLVRAIRERPASIIVQVVTRDRRDSAAALSAARPDIARLDAGPQSAAGLGPNDRNDPKFVSSLMLAEPGPMILVDGGQVPSATLLRIPEIVAAHLERLHIRDAVITTPTSDLRWLDYTTGLGSVPRAVTLRVFPSPPTKFRGSPSEIPPEWAALGWEWLRAELPSLENLTAISFVVEFPIEPATAPVMLEDAARARSDIMIVGGDVTKKVAALQPYFRFGNMALTLAGPELSDHDLIEATRRLEHVALKVVEDISMAMVDVADSARPFLSIQPYAAVALSGGAGPDTVRVVCDELAFDAYPYQILGPGHLQRLGRVPTGARPLANGRIELELGELPAWLPDNPARDQVRAQGREVLRPCLLNSLQASELILQRWPRTQNRRSNDFTSSDGL